MIDIVCFGGNFAYRACSGMGYSGVYSRWNGRNRSPNEYDSEDEAKAVMI